jgi:hypothetical protein
VSEASQHASDFPVLPFAQGDFDFGARLANFFKLGMIDLGFAFCEVDSPFESLERFEFDLACDDDRIAFGDLVFGVGQLLGQFAVVGQDDQAGAERIESADWEQAKLVGDKVDHAQATLGVSIGAQDTFGFVDSEVDGSILFEQFAIDADRSGAHVDFDTDLSDDFPVDFDAALFDQFIDMSA